jgi:5-formyltetrahydrofolate cyclo-ligase
MQPMGDIHEQDKSVLRRGLRAQRHGLAPSQVTRASRAACTRVIALPVFGHATSVVVYRAIDNEIDPCAVAAAAQAEGKTVYYPLPPGHGVGFRQEESGTPLHGADDATLVLVPGLGFDERGARLGRGGGWYDRALASHPHAVRVGLAHDFQVVPLLPEAAWDLRMHATVTEVRTLVHALERIGQ